MLFRSGPQAHPAQQDLTDMVVGKGVYSLAPHLYDVVPPTLEVRSSAVSPERGHGTLE